MRQVYALQAVEGVHDVEVIQRALVIILDGPVVLKDLVGGVVAEVVVWYDITTARGSVDDGRFLSGGDREDRMLARVHLIVHCHDVLELSIHLAAAFVVTNRTVELRGFSMAPLILRALLESRERTVDLNRSLLVDVNLQSKFLCWAHLQGVSLRSGHGASQVVHPQLRIDPRVAITGQLGQLCLQPNVLHFGVVLMELRDKLLYSLFRYCFNSLSLQVLEACVVLLLLVLFFQLFANEELVGQRGLLSV